jgi:hypothetical protein
MSKTKLMTSASRALHKAGLTLKKHSPEILVGIGIVGTIASTVMACKASTKAGEIVERSNQELAKIREVANNPEYANEYTEKDYKKDLTIVYAKTGVEFIKLYGPSIVLGAASIACILSGHGLLRKRFVELSAAYAAVDTSFKEYRGRVVERFGKELDNELKYNIKNKEVDEVVVDDEGNETVVKSIIRTGEPSEFARFFDETCTCWDRNAEYNLTFLKMRQAEANDMLRIRGHLFLNEVYDLLGMQRSKAGNIVGWVYDENNPDHKGDNYVDFGIYDLYDEQKRAFVNGYEKSILLDFNVDGNIWELMH